MEFEYSKYLWVEPADLGAMADLVRNGLGVYDAIDEVAKNWGETDVWELEWVKNDIAAFVLAVVEMDRKEV